MFQGEYQARLAEVGAKVSHSRPGRPQENGIAESFIKTMRYKKLFLEEFDTLAEVEKKMDNWLEDFYNTKRLHSSLGYESPIDFEQNWLNQVQACGLVNS